MASNARPQSVVLDDQELVIEQRRLFNFLKRYDLHQYHKAFLENGVKRLTHLKDVAQDDDSLDMIGLTRPERMRLRKKVKENMQWMGRIKKKLAGKANIFDDPAPESAQQPAMMEPSTATYRTAAIITKDEVKLGKRIGEGAHGSVHEGTWSNVHGSVAVAVKTLYGSQEVQRQFIDEANSMATIRHKHIIQLYGIVLSQPFMLVEELASFGNLHSYLKKKGASLNIHLFHIYASQIADAMRYLETRRVVHRDLAARNILLIHEDFVKLSDFGMARILDENSEVYNLSNLAARIPIAWTAVESLIRAKFSTASDIWSYGVVLWEIYSIAKTPWEGLGPIEIRDYLVQGERLSRPRRCPLEIFNLMESCWRLSPHERPTFETVYRRVQHLSPRLVRAVKVHDVAEDPDSLSFRIGDIIYLIDKPKPEWMFGMTKDGRIGHFLSDHVTDILNPISDIRAKLEEGKTKASDLFISGPTDVERVLHWGSDGRKWTTENSNEEDFGFLKHPDDVGNGQSSNSSGGSSPTCLSPPFKVQHYQSPKSASPHGPLSPQHNMAPGKLSTGDSKFIYSQGDAAKLEGASVTYGDSKFLGSRRYVPVDQMGTHLSPNPDLSRQQSEDNQYVTIINAVDPSVGDTFSEVKQQKSASPGTSPPPLQEAGNEEDEYLKMNPFLIKRGGVSGTSAVPAPYLHYIPSKHAEDPVEGHHKTHNDANVLDPNSSPPTVLPEPLQLTRAAPPIPPKDSAISSQYSYVTPVDIDRTSSSVAGDAIMPVRVRFMSTSSKKKSSDLEQKVYPVSNRSGSKSVNSRPPPVPLDEEEEETTRQRHGSESSTRVKPKIIPRQKNSATNGPTTSTASRADTTDESEQLLSRLQNVILMDEEFCDCSEEVCRESLKTYNFDVEKAKENLRVQMLLSMGIPFIDANDCKRALSHCQNKTDRAAEWLLQVSEDVELRKT